MLRVAHLSPSYGGVANAAKRLHIGLLRLGIESRFFTSEPHQHDESLQHAYVLPTPNRMMWYADAISRRIDSHMGLNGMTHVSSLFQSFAGFDVIHLHGMDNSWFNLHALTRLDRHHALVWTMHDKHLGTGACGYPEMWGDCERWRIGCGQCPKARALSWWLDCTHFVYQRKKGIVKSTEMAIVAPSHWMYDFAASSPITKNQLLSLIPNGVDTNAFLPLPAAQCRKDLDLPRTGKLLLAVASNYKEPRKGVHHYESFLHHLKNDNRDGDLGLVLVGSQLSDTMLARLRTIAPVYCLGKIDNVRTLAKAYSACDLFVIPSTIDNFPSVVLESLACGTPVAGFAVGGIPDMVKPGHTGILSKVGDTADLALQIIALLKETHRLLAMRRHCRDVTVQQYSVEVQAKAHADLYDRLKAARNCGAL